MFEKFTEQAIKVILLAQEESRRLGHNFVGTEQILLGLIGEDRGVAAKFLKSMGVNLKDARIEVEKIIGRGSGYVAVEVPFTPNAKKLLEQSLEEARSPGDYSIDTEHLLLALTEVSGGVAIQVLEVLGVDLSQIRSAVTPHLSVIKPVLKVKRHQQTAQYFIEDLGNGIKLEMVLIPGGSFMMGSPEAELERQSRESPQHEVTIKPFCMGKYQVTQAQWQAVAFLPQINRSLNSDPSNFKGSNRPVEQVSWEDAVEFCSRLSNLTKRHYRLPSEAEWEYACRAGTITPFHFGETITSELANYDADSVYGPGEKGIYREVTTDAGSFGVANNFGLYDMHGNVWEWCADHRHNSYEGAPTDGSAWLSDNDNQGRVMRGGSWFGNSAMCRSAFRNYGDAGDKYFSFGFRVACSAALNL